MKISRRARWIALLVALSAGTAFQVGANGCANYYLTLATSTFNFCAVFNCQQGTFFNFCDPFPLFFSCPNIAAAINT